MWIKDPDAWDQYGGPVPGASRWVDDPSDFQDTKGMPPLDYLKQLARGETGGIYNNTAVGMGSWAATPDLARKAAQARPDLFTPQMLQEALSYAQTQASKQEQSDAEAAKGTGWDRLEGLIPLALSAWTGGALGAAGLGGSLLGNLSNGDWMSNLQNFFSGGAPAAETGAFDMFGSAASPSTGGSIFGDTLPQFDMNMPSFNDYAAFDQPVGWNDPLGTTRPETIGFNKGGGGLLDSLSKFIQSGGQEGGGAVAGKLGESAVGAIANWLFNQKNVGASQDLMKQLSSGQFNPLNQSQRWPFQQEATSMVQNPQQWFQNGPFPTAARNFMDNTFQAQLAKSGNPALTMDKLGGQFQTALSGQYNDLLKILMGYGGFDQNAFGLGGAATQAGLAGMGANMESYRGFGDLAKNLFSGISNQGKENSGWSNNPFSMASANTGGDNTNPVTNALTAYI